MEFIYINSKSLKISISGKELKERFIDANELDYSEIKTKRFFWELMDEAYEKTGFESTNAKLYVKIFPARDGGCEMFITKAEHQKKVKKEKKGFIFATDDADKLFMLCDRMKIRGFLGESQLFCDDTQFYLVCDSKIKKPSYINQKYVPEEKDYLFACECGSVFNLTEEREAFLNEHMKMVCRKCAVEKMTKN